MIPVDVRIHRELSNKFVEIVAKHNNPIWATEELEWLILDKHANKFYECTEDEQFEIKSFLLSMNKLYK